MPFQNIRPLHILWQENIEKENLHGVFFGIVRVLLLAGVFQKFRLEHLGQRRQSNWRDRSGALNQYQSLDWYICLADFHSKKVGHLNSMLLLDTLQMDSLQNSLYAEEPRYELIVVNEPLHWNDVSIRTVNGIGRRDQGAIITIGKYLHLLQPVDGESEEDTKKRRSDFFLYTQMVTMHELGHVFGLFPGTGKEDPTDEESREAHCLDECVMWWQENHELYKKIQRKPFCQSCLKKLKQFFIKP